LVANPRDAYRAEAADLAFGRGGFLQEHLTSSAE
jgi:hypothetical protein